MRQKPDKNDQIWASNLERKIINKKMTQCNLNIEQGNIPSRLKKKHSLVVFKCSQTKFVAIIKVLWSFFMPSDIFDCSFSKMDKQVRAGVH